MNDSPAETSVAVPDVADPGPAPEVSAPPPAPGAPRARAPRQHPLLARLAEWHPALFGDEPRPLKRGIYQDLLAAHPGDLEPQALRQALHIHTRATRYLHAVAQGQPRRDLQGRVAEAMAPEHVYQALAEVFRRRQQRSREDLTPQWRRRIVQAWAASGLSRQAYAEAMRGRNEALNAVLDEAMHEAAETAARDEALLRAFEASGQSEAAFAAMYGLPPRRAAQTLARARQRRG